MYKKPTTDINEEAGTFLNTLKAEIAAGEKQQAGESAQPTNQEIERKSIDNIHSKIFINIKNAIVKKGLQNDIVVGTTVADLLLQCRYSTTDAARLTELIVQSDINVWDTWRREHKTKVYDVKGLFWTLDLVTKADEIATYLQCLGIGPAKGHVEVKNKTATPMYDGLVEIGIELRYDALRGHIEYKHNGFVSTSKNLNDIAGRDWHEPGQHEPRALINLIQERFTMPKPTKENPYETVSVKLSQEEWQTITSFIAESNPHDALKDYIEDIEKKFEDWDTLYAKKGPVCEKLLTTCIGAPDTLLNREISKLIYRTIVWRTKSLELHQRGIAVNILPIIQGDNTIGKSALVENILPPDLNVFGIISDSKDIGDPTRLREDISGMAVVEVAELSAWLADTNMTKALMDKPIIRTRLPYDRLPSIYVRREMLIGTSNKAWVEILPYDPSGVRKLVGVKGRARHDDEKVNRQMVADMVAWLEENREYMIMEMVAEWKSLKNKNRVKLELSEDAMIELRALNAKTTPKSNMFDEALEVITTSLQSDKNSLGNDRIHDEYNGKVWIKFSDMTRRLKEVGAYKVSNDKVRNTLTEFGFESDGYPFVRKPGETAGRWWEIDTKRLNKEIYDDENGEAGGNKDDPEHRMPIGPQQY